MNGRKFLLDDVLDEFKKMDVFNITVINTPDYLTDYFVIGSVDNVITLGSIVDKFRSLGVRIHGEPASGWVILDFGDFWCHVFLPSTRDYYNIERLWSLRSAMKESI
ncbi:MAG: RsfS/YbeB/iojap family protein [bacterium]|nr:RsfS/YbeB/iojap family protein [bacterium]